MLRTSLIGVAIAALAPPASAFYFEGWPGAGLTPRVTILGPGGTSVTVGEEIARVEKPVERLKPKPPEVPEPTGLALAACGLAAVGLRRWRNATRPGGTAAG